MAQYVLWLHDHATGRRKRRLGLLLRLSPRRPAFNRMLVLAGIWSGYVLGAVLGAWLELYWDLLCLTIPIACLVFFVVLDAVRPLATSKRQ
jgi:uncharacterized membrane protein YoaK (UPF0700 family)